ncbi:histidine phosphatase family protein [Mesobacillus foraminis]|uniref:histidine phosphatase family protein n=1 Tax=Mesobacillus foraminis TaxID=279826 RepID=UPI001BEB0896|nr:histidine phosphatase family protein [Mesobacillus foraminis]MBT2755336.1 histidine phosphatase family protein [Mesobacillus foraminis]
MKIGLIRHFEVTRGYPGKMVSSGELMAWQDEYNQSDVIEKEIDTMNIEWKHCYSSDLKRARTTAQKAFQGNIIFLEELREIPLSPFFKTRRKLPLALHLLFIRMAWFFNHRSQQVTKAEVVRQINKTLDMVIKHDEDLLIVGHGGLMIFMSNELLKRGFSGPKIKKAENAKIYLFEQ